MRRREVLAIALGAMSSGLTCLALRPARAQTAGKTRRVGLLAPSPVGPNDERRKALLSRLAARGFVEDRNLVLDIRVGDGRFERLTKLAAALKSSGTEVIVTFGYPAALAAKTAADGIPVVVSGSGDPVATGLAEGLSRPGGNVTGMTEMSTELSAKRLEILVDAIPNLKRVAMLWNAADLGMTLRYHAAEGTAKLLGISVQTLGVREPNDFDEAFRAMTEQRPDAILMVSDALTSLNRRRVIDFAAANRLPTIYELSSLVRRAA